MAVGLVCVVLYASAAVVGAYIVNDAYRAHDMARGEIAGRCIASHRHCGGWGVIDGSSGWPVMVCIRQVTALGCVRGIDGLGLGTARIDVGIVPASRSMFTALRYGT